jgi:hypothetical protein
LKILSIFYGLTFKNVRHFFSKLVEETKSKAYSLKMLGLMVRKKFRCLENTISKAGGLLKQRFARAQSIKKSGQFALLP